MNSAVKVHKLSLFSFDYFILYFKSNFVLVAGISKGSVFAGTALNAYVENHWVEFELFFTDASDLAIVILKLLCIIKSLKSSYCLSAEKRHQYLRANVLLFWRHACMLSHNIIKAVIFT